MFSSKHVIFPKDHLEADDRGNRATRQLVIPTQNLVLATLSPPELHKIVAEAKPVYLSHPDVIYEAADEIEYLYFPIDSVVSAVAILEDGSSVEISMTGREGVIGLPALVGGGRAPLTRRRDVEHYENRCGQIVRQLGDNRRECLEGAGGSADHNDVAFRHCIRRGINKAQRG